MRTLAGTWRFYTWVLSIVCIAGAANFSACVAARQGAKTTVVTTGHTQDDGATLDGSLLGFESAVFGYDPLPGADARARVAWAAQLARDTATASFDASDALKHLATEPARVSPARAARYRVHAANNLATIAATPTPPARPASIEAQRAAKNRTVPPGHLLLYVPKEHEHYDIPLYDETGRMQLAGVIEASRALRDHASQVVKSIHPRLLAMLYLVGQHFDAEIIVISGYRIAGVNATWGSRHGHGKACDFRISGVSIYTIAAYAESTFTRLGMGVYPTSGFVHMDTRQNTFYWIDRSGPGQPNRTRARAIRRRGNADTDPTARTFQLTPEDIFAVPGGDR